MGVTDWGEINQPLGAPALGGAGGWADSVAQALNNSDETVDARLATKVAKTGDTMTGPLILPDGNPAASEDYVDDSVAGTSTVMTARTPSEVDWKTGALANNSVLRVGSICVLSMSMNAEIEFSLSGSVRIIADIPFGYRPPANVYTSLHIAAASSSGFSGPVRCYVYPDGSVQIANVPTVTVGISSALVLQLAYQGA